MQAAALERSDMREGIHPDYKPAKVVCACGNVIEICSACHPFFTGKQKIMDTAGRIERFKTRYAASPVAGAKQEAKPAAAAKAEPKKGDKDKENRAAKRAKANAGKPKAKPAAAEVAEAAPAEGGEPPTA